MMRVHKVDFAARGPFNLDRFPIFVGRVNQQARTFDVADVVDVLEGMDVFDDGMSQLIDADRAKLLVVDRQFLWIK